MVMDDDINMTDEDIIETLRKKLTCISAVLDERGRRVWAVAETEALGGMVGKVGWSERRDGLALRSTGQEAGRRSISNLCGIGCGGSEVGVKS